MAKKTNKITVIVPVHEVNDESVKLLNAALSSVNDDADVIISCPEGTELESIGKFKRGTTFVAKGKDNSFQELVNVAIDVVGTEWFSILEFDDAYTDTWYKNAMTYIDFKTDVSTFMFFEDIFEDGSDKYLAMGNESPWASSFSQEIGYLDNEALMNYFDYYMTGSLFKKSDWVEIGGLKTNIKVTFWYEWLLRATKMGKKIFVIPKIGYIHKIGREGSLTNIYQKTMTEKEIQWWFDLAKRDFFYKEQKDKEYYVYKEKNEEDDGE